MTGRSACSSSAVIADNRPRINFLSPSLCRHIYLCGNILSLTAYGIWGRKVSVLHARRRAARDNAQICSLLLYSPARISSYAAAKPPVALSSYHTLLFCAHALRAGNMTTRTHCAQARHRALRLWHACQTRAHLLPTSLPLAFLLLATIYL